jgi:UDP-N-acetylglucosamine acyltransferase
VAVVHPLSFVAPGAELAADVSIGPFCCIESGVVIGAGTSVAAHAIIKTGTRLGTRNTVGEGAILGGDPQDRKFKNEETFLEIGDDNIIREYVTIHRATGQGNSTRVGDRCFLMAFVHLGHTCVVEDDVMIANDCGISGHCTIEQFANIGGMTGVHQYCRIGRASMIQAMSGVGEDMPPYMVSAGRPASTYDINAIGLRRLGLNQEARLHLHRAARLLFRTQLGLRNAIELVQAEVPPTKEVTYLLEFMERRYGGRNGRGDQP